MTKEHEWIITILNNIKKNLQNIHKSAGQIDAGTTKVLLSTEIAGIEMVVDKIIKDESMTL
jgi:hypothetical protein